MRARPRPGMLTQPGCSHPFPSTRMLLMQERGESGTPVDAGPPAPGAHCGSRTAPPGRRTVGVCELTKLGEVGAGGGTRGPRRPARASHPNWKEPVLPAQPPQPRAPRGTIPGAPHPTTLNSARRGRQWACKGAARRQVAARPRRGVLAERAQTPSNTPVLPAFCAAKRRGPAGPGAQSRAGGVRGGHRRRAQDPGGAGGSRPAQD